MEKNATTDTGYGWRFFYPIIDDQEKLSALFDLRVEKDITREDLILIFTCLRPNEERIRTYWQLQTTDASAAQQK